jgi:lipopolysaccharide transport system ATP-binding protein
MSLAIKVANLSKAYQLGEIGTGTLSRDIERWVAKVRGKEDPFLKVGETNDRTSRGNSDVVWSLRDINFEVQQGDAVGIIGRNGAGKSTMLKILSRVTSPTNGEISIKGRISSLLEVGTGFHPELTGRENIYLNGAILGMRKKEITRKFDEIVEFAGVERYVDTPVKRYSSGMYVRLAFAVAANLESEILIVDEVLAVGDAEFQKKCLGKMNDLSSKQGRTVLFVSHDMQAIANLTTKCVFLKEGEIYSQGATRKIINEYLDITKTNQNGYVSTRKLREPHIRKVELKTSLANNVHECTEPLEANFLLYSPFPIKDACFSFHIIDSNSRTYVHQWIFDSDVSYLREPGHYQLKCIIPSLKLYMGKYYLKCYFSEPPGGALLEVLESVCPFEVVMYKVVRSKFQWEPGTCAYLEEGFWSITKVEPEPLKLKIND